jgi:hypothetical protein
LLFVSFTGEGGPWGKHGFPHVKNRGVVGSIPTLATMGNLPVPHTFCQAVTVSGRTA